MKTVGVYEAKSHLSELINDVAAGETVVITKHGSPVARIVPERTDSVDARKLFQEWVEFRRREGISLDDIDVNELIDEGHD